MSRDSVVRLDSRGADGTEVRIQVQVDVARSQDAPAAETEARVGRAEAGAAHAGKVLGGRYELLRELGRGSMGAVWLARHRTLGQQVAVKVMAPGPEGDGVESPSTAAARFRFEAQVAARLSRKTRHVVQVTDHGHDGPLAFLVMELLEGQTLEAVFVRRGPMAPGELAPIVAQIARGLEVAHAEGVLHRDLKPANVFLVWSGDASSRVDSSGDASSRVDSSGDASSRVDSSGDASSRVDSSGDARAPLVKLLDFGLARGDDEQRLGAPFATARGVVFGTPGYMSPEQANGAVDADRRADLWSLAAIAYEGLTGELPVEGADADEVLGNVRAARVVPLRRRRPDLAGSCERFFERAFAPSPTDRFESCAELAEAFACAAGRPEATAPALPPARVATQRLAPARTPTPRRLARPPRRGKTALWVAAGTIGLVAAVVGPALAIHGRGPVVVAPDAPRVPAVVATAEATSAPEVVDPATAAPAPSPAGAATTAAPAESGASEARAHAAFGPSDLGEFKTHF